MRKHIYILLLTFCSIQVYGQFGYGITASNEIYQRYSNPKDDIAYGGSGSAILNFGIGPKIWIGGNNLSFSAETQATIGLLGLGVKDYKGLGMSSFPIIGKLNFGGLSALDKEGKFGFSIGGGIQYSKTELYYLRDKFEDAGVERKLFKTYIGQVGYGFGMSGFTAHAFLRFGYNSDTEANTFNFGLQYDFNIPKLKQITNPSNDL